MSSQVYVVHCDDAIDGVYTNFNRADEAARKLLEELTSDNDSPMYCIDTFYFLKLFKHGSDVVVHISVETVIEGAADKRTPIEGFAYMDAGRGGYPAYWSLDTNLCEFLAHNLELLASGKSVPHGWDDKAWEDFLKFHAKHLRVYAEHKFAPDDWFDWKTEVSNAQRALRNIAAILPDLWD